MCHFKRHHSAERISYEYIWATGLHFFYVLQIIARHFCYGIEGGVDPVYSLALDSIDWPLAPYELSKLEELRRVATEAMHNENWLVPARPQQHQRGELARVARQGHGRGQSPLDRCRFRAGGEVLFPRGSR